MAEATKIQWARATFNPWRGCAKIAPGCMNCYADAQSRRNPGTFGVWGPNGTRVVAAESQWRMVERLNREAGEAGERWRVFVASLADVFEDWQGPMVDAQGLQLWHTGTAKPWEAATASYYAAITMPDVRARLFALIDLCPNLDFLLVTKRPENVRKFWPQMAGTMVQDFGRVDYRQNVWLLTSISDQQTADAMIPLLLECRDLCPVLGISAEPLMRPLNVRNALGKRCEGEDCRGETSYFRGLDWVIVGGESGAGARPCNVEWIRLIVEQCKAAGVPVFVKQLGANIWTRSDRDEWPGGNGLPESGHIRFDPDGFGNMAVLGLIDNKAGDPAEWPEDLRVRQFPEVTR